MDFKLKFHVSGESKLSNAAILDRITTVLEYKKYRILSTTMDTVTFDCNPWCLKWDFEPTQVDAGVFEIHPAANGQSVRLKYYFNYLYPAIIIIFFLALIINEKLYDGLWLFGIFFAITISISIITVRNKGRALLKDILIEI